MDKLRQKPDLMTIESLCKGDMLAFDKVYRFYSPKLFSFIFRMVKTKADAEEIMQEVFVKLWESRNKITDTAKFDAWLFTIAYNTTISLIRKKLKDKKFIDYLLSIQSRSENTETVSENNFDLLNYKLYAMIDQLPPRQKEVLLLHKEHGLSYQQIADKLSISKNTVENHMVKALKFLRGNFGNSDLSALFFFLFFSI
jgi:RNA polymerase sigma-70 factor, ECF subfamily